MRRLPILLLLLWASVGCQRTPPASVFIDPALSTVIPSDAYALLGVRLEQLPSTPIYKKYLGDKPISMLDEFQKRTGIDARKDLYELLVAGTDRGAITFVKGKFSDIVGRQPNLQFGGSAPVMYKGLMLLGPEPSGVVFLNSSVAALAPHALLKSLIDQRDRGAAPVVNTFLAKASGIPHEAQVWGVSLRGGNPASGSVRLEGNLANLDRLLQSLQEYRGWADLRNGISAQLSGTCTNDDSARRLGDTVRGFVGLGRLTAGTHPELQKLYDAVQVTQVQNRVDLKANIPEDLLEAALPQVPSVFANPRAEN